MRLLQKEHLLIFQSTLPDPRSRAPVTAIARFQSTLPERGETLLPFSPARRGEVFQSTLPAWGETTKAPINSATAAFQSTLPAWGETIAALAAASAAEISIHSPRMGRDDGQLFQIPIFLDFNPLSPHGERRYFGGETGLLAVGGTGRGISIHSPRMGRDEPAPSR